MNLRLAHTREHVAAKCSREEIALNGGYMLPGRDMFQGHVAMTTTTTTTLFKCQS